jgi:hypothetical protein
MPVRLAISQAALQQEQLFAEIETLFTLALDALNTAFNAGWIDQQDVNYLIDAFTHTPHTDAFRALYLDVLQNTQNRKAVMPIQ